MIKQKRERAKKCDMFSFNVTCQDKIGGMITKVSQFIYILSKTIMISYCSATWALLKSLLKISLQHFSIDILKQD